MAWLLAVLLIGVLGSVSVESSKTGSTKNSLLEQQVLGLLEDFRELMLNGSDEIPILDPLEIEHLHIDENVVNLPGAHLTFTELLVKHASTFVVDRLSITLTSLIFLQYSVKFEGHIPALDIETGAYDLSVTAVGINVFGRGNGKVQMIKPHVSGSFMFGLWTISVSNTVIQLSLGGFKVEEDLENYNKWISGVKPRLKLNATLKNIPFKATNPTSTEKSGKQSHLTGLFLHDGASDFANTFLSNLVPDLVEFFHEDISVLISPLIQDLVNQLLEDVSIGDLFPQLYKLSKRIGNKYK